MAMLKYGRVEQDAELDALARVTGVAFGYAPEDSRKWLERGGRQHLRVVRNETGRPAGQLMRVPMGQYFGGRSVPMIGIAGVAVPPEDRGCGVAATIMREALREIREEGVGLSTLYAATQPLYRRVGYEQAGSRFEVRLPLARIDVRERDLRVRPASEADLEAIQGVYRAAACHWDGWLDRGPYIWDRIVHPRGQDAHGWVIEGPEGPEGYVFLQQARHAAGGRHDLTISDLCFSTPAGGRRLLGLLADFGSMGVDAVFHSGPTHPLFMLLSEQRWSMNFRDFWMMRVTDVKTALEARGYAEGLDAVLTLDVHDELIEENSGRFTVQVRGGRARVERGGTGGLRLDAGALASLYSGYLAPAALKQIGRAQGDGSVIRTATAVFAGGSPGMPDMF